MLSSPGTGGTFKVSIHISYPHPQSQSQSLDNIDVTCYILNRKTYFSTESYCCLFICIQVFGNCMKFLVLFLAAVLPVLLPHVRLHIAVLHVLLHLLLLLIANPYLPHLAPFRCSRCTHQPHPTSWVYRYNGFPYS